MIRLYTFVLPIISELFDSLHLVHKLRCSLRFAVFGIPLISTLVTDWESLVERTTLSGMPTPCDT